LKAVGERLRAEVRGMDVVARQGGDEFLILLTDLDCQADVADCSQRAAEAVADRLRAVLREPFLVEGQTAAVRADGAPIGIVGQLTPSTADARGLPRQDRVFVAELDLDALAAAAAAAGGRDANAAVHPLPRFPFVVRDLSIVVADALPAAIIRGTIQSVSGSLAAPLAARGGPGSIAFFDRYHGKGVPEGSVSLSLRLTFQADDRTLTDAEVQRSFDTILAALVREHGARQR